MPDETAVFGGGNHVTGAHGHVQRLNVDVLAVHRRANAEVGKGKRCYLDFFYFLLKN